MGRFIYIVLIVLGMIPSQVQALQSLDELGVQRIYRIHFVGCASRSKILVEVFQELKRSGNGKLAKEYMEDLIARKECAYLRTRFMSTEEHEQHERFLSDKSGGRDWVELPYRDKSIIAPFPLVGEDELDAMARERTDRR